MASASDKKQAVRNLSILASVHKLSLIINILAFICVYILKRPSSGKFRFILFSLPLIFCEWTIEKIGRPIYTTDPNGYKLLVKPGDDLQQSGLTEYMFDIIYLTLIIDILMCVFGSMKVWWILLVIPGYAGWKLKGIASTVLSMFMPSLRGRNASAQSATTSTMGNDSGAEGKSKRQAKLEKRAAKQQVRYR
ncbi:hypothetical protein CANINC_003525 [Pichia inconspicua]|uniref:Uncharacterized protein n=1 Tax=Pichia inconspicua TaxID=52247 RepID=A0A4T0WYJ8_9ASCO|nr:hypothetical protein CANINC_003525 [[Candida] inconspicua]